jgi:hypothetical protein
VDPVGSGQGPVAGSCKYGDESACSGATSHLYHAWQMPGNVIAR